MVIIVRRICFLVFVVWVFHKYQFLVRREGYQQPWLPVPTYLIAKLTSAFSYVRSEQNGTVTCGSEQSIKIASYGRHPFLFLRIPLVFGVKLNRRLREYRAENSKIIADQQPWRIATSPLFVFQFSLWLPNLTRYLDFLCTELVEEVLPRERWVIIKLRKHTDQVAL